VDETTLWDWESESETHIPFILEKCIKTSKISPQIHLFLLQEELRG